MEWTWKHKCRLSISGGAVRARLTREVPNFTPQYIVWSMTSFLVTGIGSLVRVGGMCDQERLFLSTIHTTLRTHLSLIHTNYHVPISNQNSIANSRTTSNKPGPVSLCPINPTLPRPGQLGSKRRKEVQHPGIQRWKEQACESLRILQWSMTDGRSSDSVYEVSQPIRVGEFADVNRYPR